MEVINRYLDWWWLQRPLKHDLLFVALSVIAVLLLAFASIDGYSIVAYLFFYALAGIFLWYVLTLILSLGVVIYRVVMRHRDSNM